MNRPTLFVVGLAVALSMAIVAAVVNELPFERRDITASYGVDGDAIVLLEGTAEEWHADAWDRWIELVPGSARGQVGRFDALSGSLDGQVEPLSDSRQVWTLRIAELDDDLRPSLLLQKSPGKFVDASSTWFSSHARAPYIAHAPYGTH